MKQLLTRCAALALALAMVLSLTGALAADTVFTDITDPETARNVEVLRMMGVIDGVTATTFEPNSTLTRAQFCKMAVEALGKSDQAVIYQNYTIFPDVKAGFWAAGYINLAVRGEDKFIAGFPDGTFQPNSTITYGQAVTVLMRLLGYKDEDVGVVWPDGYLSSAASIGLTEGMNLSGSDTVTRAQAAKLFVNLLNTNKKDSGSTFAASIGNAQEDVVMLNPDTTTSDGVPAVLTSYSENPIPVANRTGSSALSGRKGTLLLNTAGKVLTFVPTDTGTTQDITISSTSTDTISASGGVRFTVSTDTVTYYQDKKTSWVDVYSFLNAGTLATVYTGGNGKVEFVYIGGSTAGEAVIVSADGSTAGFELLTDRTDYRIYKNGEQVTRSALEQYDVATYSSSTNIVYVSDTRLTVYYEDVYPNTGAPETITAAGYDFTVLPSARESLSRFKLGNTMTLLLTQDNQVAGAVTGSSARGNAMGVADVDGGSAKVNLFCGLTLEGSVSGSAADLDGQVVTVSSSSKDKLNLSRVTGGKASGDLNVETGKVGDVSLAANARIYDKVAGSAMTQIALTDIPTASVKQSDIVYAHRNYAGDIDILVLEDVTGAGYLYGRIEVSTVETGTSVDGSPISNKVITVQNGTSTGAGSYICSAFRDGDWGGIVPGQESVGNYKRLSAYVVLKEIEGVSASDFRSSSVVVVNGTTYTVSEEVSCYNVTTGEWFASLGRCLAFDGKMSLFVDSRNVVRGIEVRQR